MRFEKLFFVIWTVILVGTLTLFGSKRFDLALVETVEARKIVSWSSPPLLSFGGGAIVIETSSTGRINDAGENRFTIELIGPKPFTTIANSLGVQRRVVHAGNIYLDWNSFFGSDVMTGTLRYTNVSGGQQMIAVEFGYPDYDQSSVTVIFYWRPLVSDEISPLTGMSPIDPRSVVRGDVTDVRIEIGH